MLYTGKQIVSRVRTHIKKRGGTYNTWFVGTSKRPRAHLFANHRVRKASDSWILMHAKSATVAHKVKSYLVKTLGLNGGAGLDDPGADFVYAYKMSVHTKP